LSGEFDQVKVRNWQILLQKSPTSAVRPADLASEGGIEPLVAAVPVWEWRPLTLVLS